MLLCKKQNIMQKTTDRHYHPDTEAITRSVRKLKDAGYIRRIIDPDDRRAVRLFLTKKGVRAAPLLEAIEREYEERICSGLSDGYMQILRTLMHTVAENRYRRMQNIGDRHVTGE
jgi:DNA-binding MarR family transcriptional regulator